VAIFALAKLAESRDVETGAHLERVMNYSRILAQQLPAMGSYVDEIDPEFVRLVYGTSPLHDIGKVGIPDGVLLKPGRLDDREFEIMKTHAEIGAKTLDAALRRFPGAKFLRMARDIAASHHERWDGNGYPSKLARERIPLCGRIVAVADVYDALTSKRVYKNAFAHEVAKGLIVKESGTQFDPAIVAAFVAAEAAFMAVREQFQEVPAVTPAAAA
jgi:putative two-component system response regulator